MNQLVPCPECRRHVRKTEPCCPFCQTSISLGHVPAPPLPSRRLGRAATFAFGASLVGASSLASCSDDGVGMSVPVYGAPAAGNDGGPSEPDGGSSGGGTTAQPDGGMTAIYGSPPGGGAGGEDQEVGGSGPINSGGEAGAFAIYGGPPGGAGAGGAGG